MRQKQPEPHGLVLHERQFGKELPNLGFVLPLFAVRQSLESE